MNLTDSRSQEGCPGEVILELDLKDERSDRGNIGGTGKAVLQVETHKRAKNSGSGTEWEVEVC